MSLDLPHRWDVPLRDLVVIFLVLKGLVVIILLHHLAGDGAHFVVLLVVRLVVCLDHRDLVLRVQCHLRVTSLHLCHEGRWQRWLSFGGLRHWGEILLVPLVRIARIAAKVCS